MPATWHAHLARQIAAPEGWEDAPTEAQPDRRIRRLAVAISRESASRNVPLLFRLASTVNACDFCGATVGHLRFQGASRKAGGPVHLDFLQSSHPWNFLPDAPYELADFSEIPTDTKPDNAEASNPA